MTRSRQPNVRQIRATDLARLHEINEANVPEVGTVDEHALSRLIELSTIGLVVEVEGHEAGFCLVLPLGTDYASVNYRWFADRYNDVMYLDRVAFDERFQRQGLGSLVYNEVERRAAAAGLGLTLEVNVEPPNPASLAFHHGRGFVEVGRQTTPYGTEVSLMHKHLERPTSPSTSPSPS